MNEHLATPPGDVPVERIPELLGELERIKAELWARLQFSGPARPLPDKLLTADEVAERFRLRPHRVYELARSGRIPHTRIGRQVRFPERSLAAWVEAGGLR